MSFLPAPASLLRQGRAAACPPPYLLLVACAPTPCLFLATRPSPACSSSRAPAPNLLLAARLPPSACSGKAEHCMLVPCLLLVARAPAPLPAPRGAPAPPACSGEAELACARAPVRSDKAAADAAVPNREAADAVVASHESGWSGSSTPDAPVAADQ
nr:skin secretory protein xP2-like [Aegilops tauschii subsp. strangulata]